MITRGSFDISHEIDCFYGDQMEIPLKVFFEYFPYHPGAFDGEIFVSPPEYEEVKIEKVEIGDSKIQIILTKELRQEFEEKAMEYIKNEREDAESEKI